MCGRYTLRSSPRDIARAFELREVPLIEPRYNIAPTQPVPVVRLDQQSGERGLSLLHWGLVPSWAKDPDIGNSLINARAETVAEERAEHEAYVDAIDLISILQAKARRRLAYQLNV